MTGFRGRSALGALVVVFAFATGASADSVVGVAFNAPSQSTWGPGGSKASFSKSGNTGGDWHFGYSSSASTGTVSASFSGSIGVTAPDSIAAPGSLVPIGLDFSGGSGSFSTYLGFMVDAFAQAGTPKLRVSAPGLPIGDSLSARGTLSKLGKKASGSDQANLNVAAFDIKLVKAGPTIGLKQSSSLTPNSISGTLQYRHRATGTTRSTGFTLGKSGLSLFADLDEAGFWDFSLRNLVLNNTYATDFDLRLGGFFEFIIGDPIVITPVGFGIFDKSFGLGFGRLQRDDAFSILVNAPPSPGGDPVPAPEPGTLALFGFGVLGVFLHRRLRR